MEWVFPIEGATASSGRAAELELQAVEGMTAASVDVTSSLVKLTFDADRVCGGEILSILSDHGCVPHRPPYVGPEPVSVTTGVVMGDREGARRSVSPPG